MNVWYYVKNILIFEHWLLMIIYFSFTYLFIYLCIYLIKYIL